MAVDDRQSGGHWKVRASEEEMMEDQEVASRWIKLCISPRVPDKGAHLGTYRG